MGTGILLTQGTQEQMVCTLMKVTLRAKKGHVN